MKKLVNSAIFAFLVLCGSICFAQKTCTSSPTTISSNTNFASITWTATGGATVLECTQMASGVASFTGNVFVDIANNKTITISNNVTINGNFDITGGPGSTLSVSGSGVSTTLHVTGNLGDAANNGVAYNVPTATDHIVVDGTLFGKNNNAFTGSGTISGGTLNVKTGSTCGSPCPVTGGFSGCISGDLFCTTNSVLPVELILFNSNSNGNAIQLTWATASEINFDYFKLEKSSDGKEFSNLANIKGHGTTNEMHRYQFEDLFPLIGKNYYRLTSVDFDNYQEVFKVIVQEFTHEKEMNVVPNPSDGLSLGLSINFDDPNGQVALYDNVGISIGMYSVSKTGSIIFSPPLKSGVYFARYSSTSFTKTVRFLVK